MTVTTSPGARMSSILRSWRRSLCTRHFLAEYLGAFRAAQLLKLDVERLAVGADAGIAETAVLRVSFVRAHPLLLGLHERAEYPAHRLARFRGHTHRLMSGHEPTVDVHDLHKSVVALDVKPRHRRAMPDPAFLQLLQHLGQRRTFELFIHRPKLRRSQLDRTLLVSPTFSNGTSGVARPVLIFSTSSSPSGNSPSRCSVSSHAVVLSR